MRKNILSQAKTALGGVKSLSQPHPLRLQSSSGFLLVGTWLSLVEHSLGVRGVGSSNLPVPTILVFVHLDCQPVDSHCTHSGAEKPSKKTSVSAQNLENKELEIFLPPRSMVLKVVTGKI